MPCDPPSTAKLILASGSPRRRKILAEMGMRFEVVVPSVQEIHIDDDPVASVRENAALKLAWCVCRHADARIIAADTVVDFEGCCVPKPRDRAEARTFLRRFSGRSQRVHTGVAIAVPGRDPVVRVVTSGVVFKSLDETTIDAYLAAVDPLDKAGAYDIDQHGELIIASHSGSYTNIMGLPCELVVELLGP